MQRLRVKMAEWEAVNLAPCPARVQQAAPAAAPNAAAELAGRFCLLVADAAATPRQASERTGSASTSTPALASSGAGGSAQTQLRGFTEATPQPEQCEPRPVPPVLSTAVQTIPVQPTSSGSAGTQTCSRATSAACRDAAAQVETTQCQRRTLITCEAGTATTPPAASSSFAQHAVAALVLPPPATLIDASCGTEAPRQTEQGTDPRSPRAAYLLEEYAAVSLRPDAQPAAAGDGKASVRGDAPALRVEDLHLQQVGTADSSQSEDGNTTDPATTNDGEDWGWARRRLWRPGQRARSPPTRPTGSRAPRAAPAAARA